MGGRFTGPIPRWAARRLNFPEPDFAGAHPHGAVHDRGRAILNTTPLPTLPRTGLAGAWDGISTERALHGQVTEALRDWSFPDRKLRFRPFNDAPSTLQP